MAQLNFSIALNLLTDKFNAGANKVKSGFSSMKMQVMTFVAALQIADMSITGFVSKLIDTARETNRATTALKNISPTLEEYGKNQKWLIDLSNKYGTDVNVLTGEFAKFTAAGNLMNMPLADQRKIFNEVDRACTAFGLTADDTNSVFLALTQMMGKGKIQAQELRLQMGEKLPVAINAMAMAAGGSIGNLDKLMKSGKLMAADVLPRFADALNKLIPNVNTDNLETSIKRMNNAFIMMVKNTPIQSSYKSLIDWITSLIKSATNNINGIVGAAISLLTGTILARGFKYFMTNMATVRKAAKIEAQAAAKAAGESFDEATWKANNSGKLIIGTFKKIGASIKAAFISILPMAIFTGLSLIIAKIIEVHQEEKKIKSMWSDYQSEISKSKHTTEIEELKSIQRQYNNTTKQLDLHAILRNKINNILGTNLTTDKEINKALNDRIGILQNVALAQAYANKKVDADTQKDDIVDKYGGAANYNYLIRRAKIYDVDKKSGIKGIKQLISPTITGLDGKEYSQTDLLKDMKMFNQLSRISYDAGMNMDKYGNKEDKYKFDNDDTGKTKKTELQKEEEAYHKTYVKLNEELNNHLITQTQYNKAYDKLNVDALAKAKASGDKGVLGSSFYKMLQNRVNNPKTNPIDSLNDVTKEYRDKLDIYKKKFENGNITQEELSEKTKELAKTYSDKALAIKNIGNSANGFLDKLKYDIALSDLSSVQSKYADDVESNRKMLEEGLMSQQDYNSAISSLSLEAAKSAISIKNIGDGADEFVKQMQKATIDNLNIPTLKDKKNDTTFDYRKQKNESNEEELQRIEEYIQMLKDKAKELGGYVSSEIDKLIKDAESKENVLKLAVLKQDIKDIQKEVSRTKWDGIKDAVSSVDSLKSSLESLYNAMAGHATLWDGIMSAWSSFATVVDTINSISDAIDNMTELTKKLGLAKKAETAIDTALTSQRIGNLTMEDAAKISSAGVDTSTSTLKKTNKATETVQDGIKSAAVIGNLTMEDAAKISSATLDTTTTGQKLALDAAKITSNTSVAASGAAASVSWIPIVGVGLAVAGFATMMAMLGKLPRFATGGIIGGNSNSGDNMLARVNSGEMILNKSQQSNLFRAINSGKLGGSANVNIGVDKVRGSDIYLAIKNYMKSTGKKL